jgi:hypothetical protein
MNRYYYLLRPPDIGCQPDGFAYRDGGLPRKTIKTSNGDYVDAFGWVEYYTPLSFEQVWKYDLQPDNPVERGRFTLWLDCGRDEQYAREVERDYISQTLEWLETESRYNTAAFAVAMIKRALEGGQDA